MTLDRTGQTWAYSAGVFVVTGPSLNAALTQGSDGFDKWSDHPIVWLDDPLTVGRAGRMDGFLEYHNAPWEEHDSFKRIA